MVIVSSIEHHLLALIVWLSSPLDRLNCFCSKHSRHRSHRLFFFLSWLLALLYLAWVVSTTATTAYGDECVSPSKMGYAWEQKAPARRRSSGKAVCSSAVPQISTHEEGFAESAGRRERVCVCEPRGEESQSSKLPRRDK